MTITHLSHFGLEKIAETETSVIFDGTLVACKRMAAAHGMEVEQYEGAVQGLNNGVATYAPATPTDFMRCWFKDGGMIHRTRDGFSLVMPIRVWIGC